MRSLRPGQPSQVGPYRLLGQLGEGGMGQVFLGRAPGGRLAAIKLVRQELASDPEFRLRFRREIDAARRVSGEWTAPVLDSDTESAVPWVATGYVPGPSLATVTGEYGPLPRPTLWALLHGLTLALTDIHAKGLIHRDLKPSNILITLNGPRVIDFGIVRAADASRATRTGAMVGSPGYMAPEQVRGEHITVAADVFALGAVLAHAATGFPPFARDQPSLHTVLYRVLHEPPELGPESGPLTGPLRELTERCLSKDPAGRPSLPEISRLAAERAGDSRVWLPAPLTSQLGRDAADLLSLDGPHPTEVGGSGPPPGEETATARPSDSPDADRSPAAGSRGALLVGAALGALLLVVGLVTVVNRPWEDGTSAAGGGDTSDTGETGETGETGTADDPPPPSSLPEEVREAGTLRVGLGTWSSPLSFAGADGEVIGVERDMVEALGELLGVELEMTTVTDYNRLVREVSASGAGEPPVIGLGAFRDTAAKRAELDVDYVDHFQEGLVLVVPEGQEDITLADLCGRSVTTWETDDILGVLEEVNDDCDERFAVETLDTLDEMVHLINLGEHPAALLPYSNAQHFLGGHPNSGMAVSERQFAVEPHGIMLPAGEEELRDALRLAVQQLIDDGTHADILNEWGVPGLALETATVNAGD
ncbi:serine/threonine-protein kinase [Streptomyces sp. NBRC 109706]|uniref:serine/threonine-protein kinase n=1 Tax=Streptomyces sp. NBRC 109706 TaxID=1550035 RepID=UPI0007852FA9|nr:serine/threonine-protein kinase [Streptomyces sp. NBRC 109706]